MSSYSYVYLDSPNSNLVCCICRMPFVHPTTSRTCAHTFCHDCILPALQASPHCPIDRSPLSPHDMAQTNPIIRHMVDELIVDCPNRPTGCEFTCQRQLLAAHLKDGCLFAEELCPDPECSIKALRKDIPGDNPRCPHRLVVCDSCAIETKASELDAHSRVCSMKTTRCLSCHLEHSHSETTSHAQVCPAAVVPCEYASHGCSWTGPRLALTETHITHCPYAGLQGFFRISDNRATELETENARLRARLDVAEGMLAVMRQELQVIKGALGPWYRPDTVPESAPLSPQSQPFSPLPSHPFSPLSSTSTPASAYSWRGPHHELPSDIMSHVPITPGEDPTIPTTLDAVSPHVVHNPYAGIAPSDLAAYFPPPSGDAVGPPSPCAMSGRSLSAALTALCTALQTHDARSRMAASAHAAELAAMRQVVAGLRMQLHAVLMERSIANTDGFTAAVAGWINPARFLNPPSLGVGSGATATSTTKL
ncbi:hypothetical protein BJV78DRAFT_1266981 [Lactifluus subvellereus]|nr:hypothetical protein BJV78DRAFT_1266981 [Lactifluus subvellereus]